MILDKPSSRPRLIICIVTDKNLASYAISELRKDVERELATLPESERSAARTSFAVFVVHNKLKPKLKELPPDVPVCLDILLSDNCASDGIIYTVLCRS